MGDLNERTLVRNRPGSRTSTASRRGTLLVSDEEDGGLLADLLRRPQRSDRAGLLGAPQLDDPATAEDAPMPIIGGGGLLADLLRRLPVEPMMGEPDVYKHLTELEPEPPVVIEPVVIEPVVIEPVVIEPVVIEPEPIEPIAIEPAVIKPVSKPFVTVRVAASVSLPSYIDRLLGPTRRDPLESVGPFAAQFGSRFSTVEGRTTNLSAVFWTYLLDTPYFADKLRVIGLDPDAVEPAITLHADGRRCALTISHPNAPERPHAEMLPTEALFQVGVTSPWNPRTRRWTRTLCAASGLAEHQLRKTARELAARVDFGLVVHRPFAEEFTACVTPAFALVAEGSQRRLGTIGTLCRTNGQLFGTTARHVMFDREADSISDPKLELRVTSDDLATDSCLVAIGDEVDREAGLHVAGSLLGHGGPFIAEHHDGGLPGLGRTVTFDGANSGWATPRIVQVDLSALDMHHEGTTRVVTDARTGFGDSGSALVLDDKLVGFATTRSTLAAEVHCATWVWAKQVFDAHHIDYAHR